MDKPIHRPATIAAVETLVARGPWATKSAAELMVLCAVPRFPLDRFFAYDKEELERIPEDIRGLRIYTVRGLPRGKIGGTEFHRIRQEIVFGLEGAVRWTVTDLFGRRKELTLTPKSGVRTPPFILHRYEALEEGSGLLVVANTLFNPEDSRTHDSYPEAEFRKLQETYR